MRYDVNGNLIIGQIADPVVISRAATGSFAGVVTLDEVKANMRIADHDNADEDAEIESLIESAVEYVEKETGLALVDQTLELRLDGYPRDRVITLRGPLLQVVTFQYTDADGDLQDLGTDSYLIEASLKNRAPRIVQPSTVTWPYSLPASDTLRIQWRVGFVDLTGSPQDDASAVPAALRSAIKLHVEAHHFRDERMMDKLLAAADNLCARYRVDLGIA